MTTATANPAEQHTRADLGPVTLWRCTKCGRWSHAKRRPSNHKRWVQTGTEIATEMESWDTGALIEVEVPAGELQRCGPFRAWSAVPLETTPRRQPQRSRRCPAHATYQGRRVVDVHLPAADITA